MATKKKEEAKLIPVSIPIHFRIPIKTPSVLAQHMVAQDDGETINLSFFEIQFPFDMDTTDATDQIQAEGLNADCVARVTIPPSRLDSIIEALRKVAAARKNASKQEN